MARNALGLTALLLTALAALSLPALSAEVPDWHRYDANDDGCLDKTDMGIMLKDGLWHPTVDVNQDGKHDTRDGFALMVLMTQWDRSADQQVNDDDFSPAEPISLPQPDVAAATSLAARLLVDAGAKLPPGQEDRLMQEWPTFTALGRPEQASLMEEAGMLALSQQNLDVAQWAFARSFDLDPARDSALGNLGFTLGQQGRTGEALTLLSRARQMNPRAAATNSNIGWLFARTGQEQEALSYYREAIREAPDVAQYRLNVGVMLLRGGDDEGAKAAFALAARLNPHDREALMMSVATNPAKPGAMEAYRAEYEKYREQANKELQEEGMEPDQPSWEDLPTSDKIEELIRQEYDRVRRERDAVIASLTEETKQKLIKTVEPVLMQGKSAKEDWARFFAGFPSTTEELVATIDAANLRSCIIATEYKRRAAAAVLGLDRTILELALTEAQAEMAGFTDGDQARHQFERTVDELYEQRMRWAEEELRTAKDTLYLELHPVDEETIQASVLTFMAITVKAIEDPVYGKDFKADGDANPLSKVNLKVDQEPAFGLSLGLVGVEWKPDSNEFKLQVGQGIIAAGTWSPKNGFGFQVGTGVSITEGSWKASAANYIKFGSDGSITVDYKVGAGAAGPSLGAKWSGSASTTLRAATHEPIMAWP